MSLALIDREGRQSDKIEVQIGQIRQARPSQTQGLSGYAFPGEQGWALLAHSCGVFGAALSVSAPKRPGDHSLHVVAPVDFGGDGEVSDGQAGKRCARSLASKDAP